ncbi:MAG: alpha/beta fold hydrolase [Aquaticitalea sp.]
MKFLPLFLFTISVMSSFAQKEETITLKNSKIHLTTFGKGKPLLIINGGPGMNSEGFASLAKELGKNNLAIIYDQRGTGASTIGTISKDTMTMDLMVDDIETIREHLKIDSWVILGHSFGGMLASYYTSKHPNRVKGLILSSSGGLDLSLLSGLDIQSRLSKKDRDSLNYWNQKIASGETTHFARLQRGKYLAPAYLYDRKYVPIIAERLTQGNMEINGLLWQDMQATNFDCKEALKSFKNPVLIIQGAKDIIGKNIAETAHKVFANSEIVYIDKSAHYGWLEQPEMYFGKIRSFLSCLN